jgi:hypothetical protein
MTCIHCESLFIPPTQKRIQGDFWGNRVLLVQAMRALGSVALQQMPLAHEERSYAHLLTLLLLVPVSCRL